MLLIVDLSLYLKTKKLFSLHDKYVIVPADKASNNIVFVCKSYYFECLIKELVINSNTSSNTTYKPTSFDNNEILANHRSFLTSLNIPSGKESEDLLIYIGYLNTIKHHTKKGTFRDHQLVRRKILN
jgi:hypothetical protein